MVGRRTRGLSTGQVLRRLCSAASSSYCSEGAAVPDGLTHFRHPRSAPFMLGWRSPPAPRTPSKSRRRRCGRSRPARTSLRSRRSTSTSTCFTSAATRSTSRPRRTGEEAPTTPFNRLSGRSASHASDSTAAGRVNLRRTCWNAFAGQPYTAGISDVRVYFATQHPSQRLLREAQQQLDRLRLPGG